MEYSLLKSTTHGQFLSIILFFPPLLNPFNYYTLQLSRGSLHSLPAEYIATTLK